jgi:hypothetical protein
MMQAGKSVVPSPEARLFRLYLSKKMTKASFGDIWELKNAEKRHHLARLSYKPAMEGGGVEHHRAY